MFEITVDEIFQINETKYKKRFKALETLARGSFGVVIKALDQDNNTEVAVKIIPKANENESSLTQFKEEVKALVKINHANIVKLFDFFETKDNMYFVMEYIKGGTLHEMMKKRGYLFSENETRVIIQNVLRAVEHLHKLNICHRDIKPDNIMFADYNDLSSVKLIDFGLSTQSCDNEQTFCGTFSFMAPERLLKQCYSEKVDIWSIGIVAYMLLKKGKHPFYSSKETKESYTFKFQNYSNRDIFSALTASTSTSSTSSSFSLISINFLKKVLEIRPSGRYHASFSLQHPWITQDKGVLRKNILREEMERINPKIKDALLTMIILSQLSKVNSIAPKDKDKTKDKVLKNKDDSTLVFIRKSKTKDDSNKKFGTSMNTTRRSKILLLKNPNLKINFESPIINPHNKKSHMRISSLCPTYKKQKKKIFLKSEDDNNQSDISNSNPNPNSNPNSYRENLVTSSSSKPRIDFTKRDTVAVSPFHCYQSSLTKKSNNIFNSSSNRFLSKMTMLSKFNHNETKTILTQPSETRKKGKIYLPLIKPKVTIEYIDC